jgi:hypothetical protein
MANQNNFKTNIPRQTVGRILASRVFTNNLDKLLELQVPAMVPEEFYVEMSLYSLADNSLIYNTSFPSTETGLFELVALKYDDLSIRRMLFIDFSKTTIPFVNITGRYQLVVNFFAKEIGDITTQSLWVSDISPSRTELQLDILPEYKNNTRALELVNFASPQINKLWVTDAIKQVFNQSSGTASNIPTDKTQMTPDIVTSFLPKTVYQTIYNTSSQSETLSNAVESTIQNLLNTAYGYATSSIDARISSGQQRFTQSDLVTIVSSSLSTVLRTYPTTNEFTLL